MSRVNLTAKRIKDFELSSGSAQAFLWDATVPGLGVRATSGAKAFIFQGRLHGKSFRVTIGDVRAWTIEQAQVEARRFQGLVDRGIDPRQEKVEREEEHQRQLRALARQKVTFCEAWADYVSKRQAKWSAVHYRDHLQAVQEAGLPCRRGKQVTTAGVLARLLDEPLVQITPAAIESLMRQESAQRPTKAALGFRLLRGFCNWAEEEEAYSGLLPQGACSSKRVREQVARSKAKKDHLQVEQLPIWFHEVRRLPTPAVSAYLQACLLTGARREELLALRWVDVDFTWGSIRLHDKVESERVIPLTPYVASLLDSLPRENEWVFASRASKSGRLQDPRLGHNRALAAGGLPNLTIHGLRRSFASLSEWVDVPSGVVAQIQGHKPSATAEKHYIRRPIDLLRKWHVRIEEWILERGLVNQQDPAQIVALRAAS